MGYKQKILYVYDTKFIYKITCLINLRVYIGETANIKRRFWNHQEQLAKGKHGNDRLQEDYNKYGVDSFKYEIIEEVPAEQNLERESYWINYYGGIESDMTYNMQDIYNQNRLVRNKISVSNKGKTRSNEYKQQCCDYKNLLYNTEKGKQIKEQISKTLKDFYKSDKGIQQRIKQSMLGKVKYSGEGNPMYGKHHTEETKKLISEVKHKNYVEGKYTSWNKGKKGLYKPTDETKQKQRIASTKYNTEFIEQLRQEYKQLGKYSEVAKIHNMNPLCVSRLIRFGSTQYPNKKH